MASSFHICLSFTTLFIFSFNLSYAVAEAKPQSIIFPIRKDSMTNQYYTKIDIGTPQSIIYGVIDLGGQFSWFDCESGGYTSSSYRSIQCGSKRCKQAKGTEGCLRCSSAPRPGCNNNTCGVWPYNPIKPSLAVEGLGEDFLSVSKTDGRVYLVSTDVPHFQFACVKALQVEGLAKGTEGMVGLARTTISLHKQLALAFKFPHKFALCIPSSNNGFGNIFIGGGPYYMPPYGDVSTELITTPLVTNPVSTAQVSLKGDPSDEYFIEVKSIRVDKDRVTNFNASLLTIKKYGVGGTKISTIAPYTILHTSIYKALVKDFVKKAALRKMTRVASVASFGACYSSKSIATTMTGPDVPTIDLVMQKESVYWRVYGANSMVKVKNGAWCLGFVDGGPDPNTSIVLGAHQLEDNLIEFDLDSSKLGFTSSLLLKNTSCSQHRVF